MIVEGQPMSSLAEAPIARAGCDDPAPGLLWQLTPRVSVGNHPSESVTAHMRVDLSCGDAGVA